MSKVDEVKIIYKKVVGKLTTKDKVIIEQGQHITELEQKIKDLEHRLSNCIEPKFKKGDKAYALISGVFDTYIKPVDIIGIMLGYKVFDGDDISNQNYTRIFATEEEAKAKLEELKNV